MKELDRFLFQPKSFEEILPVAKIVIDTNVLLAAYQYRNITFKELLEALESLNSLERLLIPSHVLKEFFKNRPDRIVEIIQTVQQIRDKQQNIKSTDNIDNKIPSMEYLNNNKEIQETEKSLNQLSKEYNAKLKEYRGKLSDLIDELKSFFNHDPILEKYEKIFRESYYKPENFKTEQELVTKFKERIQQNQPPGYKDGKKTTNGEGDYKIWEHILGIKESDVIFVTADNKSDWVYKDPNDNVINARRELVEEFYDSSGGKTFCIVHPSIFIKAYNPNVNHEIIEDLNNKLLEDDKDDILIDFVTFEANKENIFDSTLNYENYLESISRNRIPHNKAEMYKEGDEPLLDKLFEYLRIVNESLYIHVRRMANKIANDYSLSSKERAKAYFHLVEWGMNKVIEKNYEQDI
ncbi:PIN domain-containing protein [Peribacillus frigoritolerans]|uniref:PIN domain-containing protein n=1 Tax=Peribacillus frigoritolerans TaxID=450367 RepID=UPI003F7E4CAA